MDKILLLKTYVDGGVGDIPFPDSENQIEIGSFRYNANRMGGAPTITATIMYPTCLDGEWSAGVYAEFNGEKYYLKQTPTSSYSNEDARYKHDVELVSERKILDDTYFYDAVVGTPQENDKPVTNDTKFNFYGNIFEFAKRMNASLQYTKLQKVNEDDSIEGYYVVIDDEIATEDKLVSFDNAVFSQALQESYNTFGIPFYFVGKEIHLGFTNNVISDILEYGVDDALLSITKQNSNFKVVNRASGKGSTDNIPYYYPNNSPKGDIEAVSSNPEFTATIVDSELYSSEVKLDGVIKRSNIEYENLKVSHLDDDEIFSGDSFSAQMGYGGIGKRFEVTFDANDSGELSVTFESEVTKYILNDVEINDATFEIRYNLILFSPAKKKAYSSSTLNSVNEFLVPITEAGEGYRLYIDVAYAPIGKYASKGGRIMYNASYNFGSDSGWTYDGRPIELKDVGLKTEGDPSVGDTITQRLVKYVKTTKELQPSIYRATDGKERFYNAINYPFDYVEGYELQYAEYVEGGKVHNDLYKKDDGTYMKFENPYVEGNPKEHVFNVEDLKPTIKEMTNDIFWQENKEGETINVYQRIDMFSEFAYDEGDNDETDKDGKFLHPYFFAKLRKLNFNLFDCAIEQQPMTFSMTSGNCGACNFEIGVSEEEPQYNPVQVDENGNLVRDEDGRVLCGLEGYQDKVPMQPQQQDTINNEVWIALKKEESTYGILMPKAPKYDGDTLTEAGHRPKPCSSVNANDGDTFVILGIHLPEEYILSAERKLEKKIIQYIGENNKEKFNFSISFSRIFLAENSTFLEQLNENARLTIKYNNLEYLLYVSSFSYNMSEGDVLPEIRVELDDTLTISQNALQNAINSVKSEIGQAINAIDVVALGSLSFLRKDIEDIAQAPIGFSKGLFFGDKGNINVNPDGSSKLTIDYLDVTRKATFTSLEIQEKTHVGGQFLITPASMTCSYVEELEDAYRCYFQNEGEGGEEIFNTFAIDDQAVCQTYNAWGSKYYWKLVTGIGDNYIDLSKSDCAPESDTPSIGDKIIQLGNRTDITRQAAQVLSSYGENSPSFIMYNGINSFSLEGKEVTGILWNPATQEPQMYSYGNFFFGNRTKDENGEFVSDFITFQPNPENPEEKKLFINADVQFGGGSKGLSDLSEWQELQGEVSDAIDGVKKSVQEVQDQIDGVVENYYLEGAPTIDNYPAIEWDTDVEKLNHVGDAYINIATEEQDPDNAGKAWRWCICGEEENLGRYKEIVVPSGTIVKDEDTLVGKLNTSYSYINVQLNNQASKAFVYGQYIEVYSGPPVKVRIDTDGSVYIYDQYGRYTGETITLKFYHSEALRAIDKDGNEVFLHWHPIADTDGVKALLEAYKAQSGVDELQYLKGTFAKGKTEIAGGVVLTEMVAVTDEDNENIEAFINGSEFGVDDEHGKLLIAAGIDDIENPNGAKTRVYEDGTVETNKMHLKDGCTIGNSIRIDDGAITIDNVNTNGMVWISEYGIESGGANAHATVGGCAGAAIQGFGYAGGGCPIEDKGIGVQGEAIDGEYAFYSQRGVFAGLRTRTSVIATPKSSSDPNVLTNIDFNVLINATSRTYYLKLPDNPLDGQEYHITTKGADIVLSSSKYNMYSLKDNNTSLKNSFTISLRGLFRVKYYKDASQWVFNWIDSY